MKQYQVVLGVAFAVMLLLGGCSGSGANARDDTSRGIPEKEQGTVTVGDVTISSETKKPPDFPDEIPLPNNAVIVASMANGDGASTLVFDADVSFQTAVQLYKNFVKDNGYSATLPVTEDEQTYWFSGSRGKEHLVIILNKDLERDGRSSGTLSYKKA